MQAATPHPGIRIRLPKHKGHRPQGEEGGGSGSETLANEASDRDKAIGKTDGMARLAGTEEDKTDDRRDDDRMTNVTVQQVRRGGPLRSAVDQDTCPQARYRDPNTLRVPPIARVTLRLAADAVAGAMNDTT